MHVYTVDKINQYYLMVDQMVQQELEGGGDLRRRDKRMMLQKLTIVQALVEMLRDKDFTYFTK